MIHPIIEALISEVRAEREAEVQLVARGERSLRLRRKGGGAVVVTLEMNGTGGWRATEIDAGGEPIGHSTRSTFDGAVRAALERMAIISEEQE